MDLNRAPITKLQIEKNSNTSKLSVLDSLSTRMMELQISARALKADGLFSGRTAASATTASTWTTTASSGTAAGAYTFAVSQLATTSTRTGSSDIGLGLAATNDVSGVTLASMSTATAATAGVFSVNGAQVTIALTDSLQAVFNKISTATGGAVTGSYDATTDKISLASASAIVLGAGNDTSNFLSVTRLANNGTGAIASSTALGTTSLSAPLASARLRNSITAVDGSGNGTFSVNGVNIAYNVNSDSLSTILSRINSSTAGVTASYDSAQDRVVLTNKNTGDLGLSVSEAAGGFLDAVGLGTGSTLSRGKNALFTVNNGATLTSASNTLSAASHGITGLSVTATTDTTQTINVTSATTSMRTAIDDFIKKFNMIQTYIDDQTKVTSANGKVTAALMSNNREIQSWSSTMRSTAFASVSGVTGSIQRLDHLGIDFMSSSSQLVVKDTAKLEAALRDNPTDVEAFFKTASSGFAAKFDAFTSSLLGTSGTGSTGMLGAQKDTLNKGTKSIDTQISNIERQLTSERSRLEASFIAMEQAQATIKQMQAQLTNAFGTSRSA